MFSREGASEKGKLKTMGENNQKGQVLELDQKEAHDGSLFSCGPEDMMSKVMKQC